MRLKSRERYKSVAGYDRVVSLQLIDLRRKLRFMELNICRDAVPDTLARRLHLLLHVREALGL